MRVQQTSGLRTNLQTEIEEFLNYLRVERGLAENTVTSYARDLRKYGDFLSKAGIAVVSATSGDVRRFLLELEKQRLDSRTIARQIVSLRSLYTFLRREAAVTVNPTENLESPRVWKVL